MDEASRQAPACRSVPEELESHYRIRASGVPELAIPLPGSLDLERLVQLAARKDPARLVEQLWQFVSASVSPPGDNQDAPRKLVLGQRYCYSDPSMFVPRNRAAYRKKLKTEG